jgi:hypothetical protein
MYFFYIKKKTKKLVVTDKKCNRMLQIHLFLKKNKEILTFTSKRLLIYKEKNKMLIKQKKEVK